MLKMAVLRGDLHILAQVLVNLIENKKLSTIQNQSEVITLAIKKQCSPGLVSILCQVGMQVSPEHVKMAKSQKALCQYLKQRVKEQTPLTSEEQAYQSVTEHIMKNESSLSQGI